MLENKDRFWDTNRARVCTADRSGNSHTCTQDGGTNDLIGSSKRTVKESVGCPAAGRRTRTTVTQSAAKRLIPDRIDSAVRNFLLLLAGPGAETLLLSGAFEPIASSLAAALQQLLRHFNDQHFNDRCIQPCMGKPRPGIEASSRAASKQYELTLAAPAAIRIFPASQQCAIAIPQFKNNSYGGR